MVIDEQPRQHTRIENLRLVCHLVTDLMPGSPDNHGHGAASTSRVDWIEIYAPKVPRSKAAQTNNNR